MLMPRIIPCLDVRAGRIVKGVRFAHLRDAGDPAERAALYESQGADELVILDVSATLEERAASLDTVRAVRAAVSIPLCVGGGVCSPADVQSLLEAGADKVAMNSAAVARPDLIREAADQFGSQCIVLSIDAARAPQKARWSVRVRSGTTDANLDAVEWAAQAQSLGAGEILLTSWDSDGMRNGYDLNLLTALRRAVTIPIIASGGAGEPAHMLHALRAGADAVLAASIFHDNLFPITTVKQFLTQNNQRVRTC